MLRPEVKGRMTPDNKVVYDIVFTNYDEAMDGPLPRWATKEPIQKMYNYDSYTNALSNVVCILGKQLQNTNSDFEYHIALRLHNEAKYGLFLMT